MRSARSKTVTQWPARLSWAAQARPAGPEPTTATFLPVRVGGRLGHDPAFLEALVDDGALDALDGDRRLVDAEDARALAGSGTDAAGELREVVGLVQPFEGLFPQSAINQVVPLRNEVVDRTAGGHAFEQRAGVAEGDAAVHAAGARLRSFFLGVLVELVPVANAPTGGRASGSSRGYSMNPVGLPMNTPL